VEPRKEEPYRSNGPRIKDAHTIGETISSTWNTIVREKTTRSGMMTASIIARTFLDLLEEAVMSSLDDSNIIKRIAMSAPPTPMPIAVVNETADEADVVVVDIMLIPKSIMSL
jgi:hypothetical protein